MYEAVKTHLHEPYGRIERQGRRILNDIKKRLGKTEDQFVTIEECCRVKGLPLATVISLLDD